MSVCAVAMSLSTIIVAANAQMLRRLKLQRVSLSPQSLQLRTRRGYACPRGFRWIEQEEPWLV